MGLPTWTTTTTVARCSSWCNIQLTEISLHQNPMQQPLSERKQMTIHSTTAPIKTSSIITVCTVFYCVIVYNELVSSFLTAHQHIKGHSVACLHYTMTTHAYHVITEEDKSTTADYFHADWPVMHRSWTDHILVTARNMNIMLSINDTHVSLDIS